jgi:hypothetical protein
MKPGQWRSDSMGAASSSTARCASRPLTAPGARTAAPGKSSWRP